MSTRGRGLSCDSADHARHRLVEDVVAFTSSIGEPAGLVGFRAGARWRSRRRRGPRRSQRSPPTSRRSRACSTSRSARFRAGVRRADEAVSQGRLADGSRAFAPVVCNDEELAALEASGYLEAASGCAPSMVQDILQGQQSQGPAVSDPAVLAHVTAPLLLLHGSRTAMPWFTRNVRHAAGRVADAQTREVPGVGHYAPMLQPEPVAEELARFFESALQPA